MLYGDNFYNATNELVSKIIRVSWVTVREGHRTRSKDWQRGKREIAGHDAVICISPRLTTNIFRLKILFTHPWLSTLTYALARDLNSVRMHQYAKYLGQRSFRWKVIVLARQSDRRIQTGDRSSAWPLKWSVHTTVAKLDRRRQHWYVTDRLQHTTASGRAGPAFYKSHKDSRGSCNWTIKA